MSLYSYITGSKHQQLRDRLKFCFEKPDFNLKNELVCPPITKNSDLIGTAFDYLFRFHLEFLNKGQIIQTENWIADRIYERQTFRFKRWLKNRHKSGISRPQVVEAVKKFRYFRDQYNQAKCNYKKFLVNGQLTDELVTSSIFLARLDVVHRAGPAYLGHIFMEPDRADVDDLQSLISSVDFDRFIAKDNCYLNPTFGAASKLVGDADADIIIDNTLIEIKVVRELKLKREYLNQLLGYYILSLISGINENPEVKPIENIGVYFARFGVLWTIPLSKLGDEKKYDDFKDWFVNYIDLKKRHL